MKRDLTATWVAHLNDVGRRLGAAGQGRQVQTARAVWLRFGFEGLGKAVYLTPGAEGDLWVALEGAGDVDRERLRSSSRGSLRSVDLPDGCEAGFRWENGDRVVESLTAWAETTRVFAAEGLAGAQTGVAAGSVEHVPLRAEGGEAPTRQLSGMEGALRSIERDLTALVSKGQVTKGEVTTVLSLVVSRVGQGRFRDDVMRHWGHRCAVTGLMMPPLLVASHIKPWAACTGEEELQRHDPANGLALSVPVDALFDGGWMTVLQDGVIALSRQFVCLEIEGSARGPAALFGVDPAARIDTRKLTEAHQAYLAYHRAHVFRQ